MPKVDLENVEEAFAYAAEIREHAPSLFERLETAKPEDALEMLTYAEQLQKATTYLRPSARQAVTRWRWHFWRIAARRDDPGSRS